MNRHNVLKKILSEFSKDSLNVSEIGVFQKNISKTIKQYKPNDVLLDNILVYHDSNGQITEVCFFGEKFFFSLNELFAEIKMEHSLNYSYRDNVTKLTFYGKNRNTFFTSMLDNRVEIDGESLKITNEAGETTIQDRDERIVNHVSINFKRT